MGDIVNFHVGETVTAIQKTRLRGNEGAEVIVYGTIMGSIGCFIPFTNREEVDFSRIWKCICDKWHRLCVDVTTLPTARTTFQ
eukprot:TRINITY_DN984_c0_g1_i1.p1 TRINITY_DN984_c0_g1~~TRINITY_DN984_c0_g1_i1.p1  ORF type:complete len:94 (+),score=12.51 TRINITY_DN984_c0_g1_i1:36-284(+)